MGLISEFSTINHFLNKKFYYFLFKKFRFYKNYLFDKRINLFLDFLKLISLYFSGEVQLETFCLTLAQIFKFLQKKQHTKFFIFLKNLISIITNKFIQKKYNAITISGIKFIINGRLKGKDKKSKFCIKKGIIPIQSFNRNIDFSKTVVVNMRYGVFGLRI